MIIVHCNELSFSLANLFGTKEFFTLERHYYPATSGNILNFFIIIIIVANQVLFYSFGMIIDVNFMSSSDITQITHLKILHTYKGNEFDQNQKDCNKVIL